MPRADLLALTSDDLAALTNRGTVKRCARELESGEATFALSESDAGEVIVEWSDQARCVIPAGKTAAEARCSCPATTLCRHVVRSILAYQKAEAATAADQAGGAATAAPAAPQPWDPGQITDEQLAGQFKKTVLTAAQGRFQQGLLIELVRSAKPTARFHQLACCVRFIVPGDVRYTHCDCAEAAPCSHAPLAVWAFRRLPAEQLSGMVSTQSGDLPVPGDLLDGGEALLAELIENGLAGLPPNWKDRAARMQASLADAELIWPAEALAEIAQQFDRYATHDARFSPQRVAELVGEWLIRADAIRSGARAVPQLLIRGSRADRPTDIGSARYVGLGCGVEQDRAGATVTAYLQDVDSGSLVAIAREFNDPTKESGDSPRDFPQLASTPVVRGISLAALGGGQLLLQGGKRGADHRLVVGRAKASINPQNYAWDALRAPLLVEDFAELQARLAALPPASLRPRYVAENLHVVPIAEVAGAHFDEASQSVQAYVRDGAQEVARLHHPYTSRGREGCEALLAVLRDPAARRLRYVAARVEAAADELVLHPITLVFEGAGGGRSGVQPWVDRRAVAAAAQPDRPVGAMHLGVADPILGYPRHILAQLGDLLVVGLRRSDAHAARRWNELARSGEAVGYDRIAGRVGALARALTAKLSAADWSAQSARGMAMWLAVMGKLAADLQGGA
jgi:hypothetical protein